MGTAKPKLVKNYNHVIYVNYISQIETSLIEVCYKEVENWKC